MSSDEKEMSMAAITFADKAIQDERKIKIKWPKSNTS